MNARTNPSYQAVTAALDAAGIAFAIRPGGKHASITFTHNGQPHRIIVPQTPSDRRAWLNARSHIRRLLRQAPT